MRVLALHPYFSPKGGAEVVAANILRFLVGQGHEVTLYVAEEPELARRALRVLSPDFAWESVPMRSFAFSRALGLLRKPLALLGYALLIRSIRTRHLEAAYDLVFSTYGECDLVGKRGAICFIHYPVFPDIALTNYHIGGRIKSGLFRRFYTGFCRLFSGVGRIPARTQYLANSIWTAKEIARLTGHCKIEPIYAPVTPFPFTDVNHGCGCFGRIPFRIVSVGRIVSYKGHDLIVRTAGAAARGAERPVEVLFIGRGNEHDAKRLRALRTERVDVQVRLNLDRATIGQLLAGADVGVSAFEFEHFGLAVGEMSAAGLPVFVPNGGGQTEIVPDARFIYSNENELQAKILRMMTDEKFYLNLRETAASHRNDFNQDAFCRRLSRALASVESIS